LFRLQKSVRIVLRQGPGIRLIKNLRPIAFIEEGSMKIKSITSMLISVCFALIVLFSEVYGQFMTGNKIYENYLARKKEVKTNLDFSNAAFFLGFTAAVADCFNSLFFDLPSGETGVTVGQIADVFGKYLENHPELRHLPAVELCKEALREAFPKRKDEAPGAADRPAGPREK